MKASLASAAFSVLLLAVSVAATDQKDTDARSDGFLGPVRTVSTQQEMQRFEWPPGIVESGVSIITCWECEYDPEGNRTKRGQMFEGEFRGDIFRIVRGESGQITERIVENYKGEITCHDFLGPFGITERVDYNQGKPTGRATWSYDPNGQVAEFHHYDRDGVEIESSYSFSDASGDNKEQWDFGRDGKQTLHFVQTYDPKTEIWTFTNLNENGAAKVAVVAQGHKLLSYWQESGEDHEYGSGINLDRVGKSQDAYNCHPDETCDKVTSYFPDGSARHVSRKEWRDRNGVMRLSMDFEYQLDSFGNWTRRTVWVWTQELGERRLYETDFRNIRYWTR